MRIPLFHVDAFTSFPFSGNPAAVCLLNSWLDDDLLRKVAAENQLSATAFLVERDSLFGLRWFTPLCEIRLCGHATLATAHVLLNVMASNAGKTVFTTRMSGVVTVQKEGDGLLSMSLPAWAPLPSTAAPNLLATALGQDVLPSQILEVNDTYLAVFQNESTLRAIQPDFVVLEQLHPYAVIATAPGEASDLVLRYFAPGYGVPEDPVTGSAHCSLAPYWAGRLKKSQLHSRQLSERGGELWCEVDGDRVVVKGQAVLTMQGTLEI
jgi:PhzF family phenazine biosynthesis protein